MAMQTAETQLSATRDGGDNLTHLRRNFGLGAGVRARKSTAERSRITGQEPDLLVTVVPQISLSG